MRGPVQRETERDHWMWISLHNVLFKRNQTSFVLTCEIDPNARLKSMRKSDIEMLCYSSVEIFNNLKMSIVKMKYSKGWEIVLCVLRIHRERVWVVRFQWQIFACVCQPWQNLTKNEWSNDNNKKTTWKKNEHLDINVLCGVESNFQENIGPNNKRNLRQRKKKKREMSHTFLPEGRPNPPAK